jgi:hypothetical protein
VRSAYLTPDYYPKSRMITARDEDKRFGIGPSSVHKKTILICEDDRDLLRVYTLALRSKYDVVTATSGREGIDKYSQLQNSGKKRRPDSDGLPSGRHHGRQCGNENKEPGRDHRHPD